tara:strand:+ start:405 stop:3236 length:2832 start_codon:yes stop_codon:yes gene_type:complete
MPKRYKVYSDFSGGVNSKANPKFIQDNELVEAAGVLCDEKGMLRTSSPSLTGGGSDKIGGLSDMSATIYPGRGLFSFKTDYSFSDAVNTITARESEYLCIADKSNSQVDLWGYNDAGGDDDHQLKTNILDLGSGTAMEAEFYYADGALRVSDASFDSNNTVTWFGRIGDASKKKLLGVELDREWVAKTNSLDAPTVGFVTPSLSGTATGDTESLIYLADGPLSGVITSMASTTSILTFGRVRITDSGHSLAAGDIIEILGTPFYNGIHQVTNIHDSNNFDIKKLFIGDTSTASSTWIKRNNMWGNGNFQGWATGVAAATSGSRWLVAYDIGNDDVWKILSVTEASQDLTTTANSSDWDGNTFAIYPFPGDGILLEASQSQDSTEGFWAEGEYEFAQSFIYEGNQESKVVKLLGDNVVIDLNEVLNVKIHVSGLTNDAENNTYINSRLIGGRVYIRKSGTNDFWSLLVDMDYRVTGPGGGGTRISTIDDYDAWTSTADNGTGGEDMGWTRTNFKGFKSIQYTIKGLNVESYENINGFSSSEYALSFGKVAGYGYKASVVAGYRVFVANVNYIDPDSGVVKVMGDAIFYTPVSKYDTFPSSYKLNIAGNDGDEFTALEYFNGVLFAFKKNSLYLIDISNPIDAAWKLLTKYDGMGVPGPWGVTKTSTGIVWASKSGLYLWNQNQPVNLTNEKISHSDWVGFYTSGSVSETNSRGSGIGWDSSSNKIIVSDNVIIPSEIRMFDLDTGTWTAGYPLATNPYWEIPGGSATSMSNMITFTGNEIEDVSNGSILPHGGALVYTDPNTGNADDCDVIKMSFNDTSNSAFVIVTKDDDFGSPNVFKKIYAVDIEYITDASSDAIDVKYEIDGNDVPNSSSNALASNQTLSGVAGKDNVNILKITPSPIKCRSFALRISSYGTTTCYLEIISIGIRFRPLQSAAVATETSSA